MEIAFDPDEEGFIAAEVASGRYGSPAEVVRHALRLLTAPPATDLDAALALEARHPSPARPGRT